jgi:hypothetical protein
MIESLVYIIGISLLFLILGVFLNRESKRKKNAKNSVYALIIILFSLNVLIIGGAYALLYNPTWSDNSRQLFFYISLLSFVSDLLIIGLQLFRNARQCKSRLALVISIIWICGSIMIATLGLRWVSKMNDCWTRENEKQVIDRCDGEKFDCYCKLEIIKKKYSKPSEYYLIMENTELNKQKIKELDASFIDKCSLCDTTKNATVIQKIEGLPDDF